MLVLGVFLVLLLLIFINVPIAVPLAVAAIFGLVMTEGTDSLVTCLLYTSPSPRDQRGSRMPSSA